MLRAFKLAYLIQGAAELAVIRKYETFKRLVLRRLELA
jgi:hypothetical protein